MNDDIQKIYDSFCCSDEHYTGDTSCCDPVLELKETALRLKAELEALKKETTKDRDMNLVNLANRWKAKYEAARKLFIAYKTELARKMTLAIAHELISERLKRGEQGNG